MRTISTDERRRRLGLRHHLAAPADDVERVADDLVGLHSSDPVSVYLSAWARVGNLTVADVERALYEDRSLVRMLGMRRTMFAVPLDLAAVMNAACTSGYVAAERHRLVGFLEDQLVDGDGGAWLEDVLDKTMAALHRRGEATATELVEDVPELSGKLAFGEGTTWQGSFGLSTRVLFLLATDRRVIRARPLGSWKSSQYRWAPLKSWIRDEFPEMEPSEARRQLATRWLRAYGPGSLKDLKWWTGWTVARTRAALEEVGAVSISMNGEVGYVLPDDLDPIGEVGEWVALLPGLDPTVMGWKERDWFLGSFGERLFDTNGNAGPTVWWNGSIVGAWSQRPDGEVVFELLEKVPTGVLARIEGEAARLTEWLDGVVIRPRFSTTLEKGLRS